MQEQEERQRELLEKLERERIRAQRERLAEAKIQNVQGLQDPDAIFGPTEEYVERRRPITRLFFSVYDNLGSLMAINIFTFVLTLPLIFIVSSTIFKPKNGASLGALAIPPLILFLVIAAPAWAAASSFCAKVVEDQMHAIGDYWKDYRLFLGRSILLAFGQWLVGGILAYAAGWYLGRGGAFLLIGIVSLYALIFWALAGLYVWPLLVRNYSWRAILRNAAVLVVAAPLRTVGILIFLIVVGGILSVTGIGLALLVFALWAMLPNQALVLTRERLEKRREGRTG